MGSVGPQTGRGDVPFQEAGGQNRQGWACSPLAPSPGRGPASSGHSWPPSLPSTTWGAVGQKALHLPLLGLRQGMGLSAGRTTSGTETLGPH